MAEVEGKKKKFGFLRRKTGNTGQRFKRALEKGDTRAQEIQAHKLLHQAKDRHEVKKELIRRKNAAMRVLKRLKHRLGKKIKIRDRMNSEIAEDQHRIQELELAFQGKR